ncbi:hypothetical protein LCGC14_1056690 [marine sediment metagenome]|uniref:Uncharacterized protein n=1 Tax=marine sediment metagenome TaxID=412755 RepID=A0A0F9MMD9_9ZZZZ
MEKKITTIQIHKNTLNELKRLKIIDRETYESVIKRLIFLPKSIIKIKEIINGIMQPISHGQFEQFEKEIRGDLVKILELIVFLFENRILKEYKGDYFSLENLKNKIENGMD